MKSRVASVALFLVASFSERSPAHAETALTRYVNEPDPNYTYELVRATETDHVMTYVLSMTSQQWLTKADVNRTLWKHWLYVVVPEKVDHDEALLFISGGANRDSEPDPIDNSFLKIAASTHSVVTLLEMVPNQPLSYHGESEERYEDSLIAYGWDQYLKTGDPKWLARLPMTKSAVRAMDTIIDFLDQRDKDRIAIDSFVVAGASKRGWTTWTTAIADPRVKAIVPIVIDMLNVIPSFERHWEAYGFWAPAVKDYVEFSIPERMDTDRFRKLTRIVEPFEYRDQLTLPKLLINSASDEFFLPDSWEFYWDELKGPKSLRYVPNTGHGLDESDALESLIAFYSLTLHDRPAPQYNWRLGPNDQLIVSSPDPTLKTATVWRAVNEEARDFRVTTIERTWESKKINANAHGDFVVQLEAPEKGWSATFVELTFQPKKSPTPIKLTSGVYVRPTFLPFDFETKKPRARPETSAATR